MFGASPVLINRDERIVVDVFFGLIKIAGVGSIQKQSVFPVLF